MNTSKLWPEVSEGWRGSGSYRAYALTKNHGKRTITISMPERQFMRMEQPRRTAWLSEARRRVELGHA